MSWEDLKATIDWMSIFRFIMSALIVCVFSAVVFTIMFVDAAKLGEAGLMLVGVLCSSFNSVVTKYIGSPTGTATTKERPSKAVINGR